MRFARTDTGMQHPWLAIGCGLASCLAVACSGAASDDPRAGAASDGVEAGAASIADAAQPAFDAANGVGADLRDATPSGDASGGAAHDANLDGVDLRADAGSSSATLEGWAAESGDGVATTTGGGTGRVVVPASVQELLDYAARDEPLVIELHGTFVVPRLQLASNKTLRGVGDDATIEGALRIRGKSDAFVENVIVENLHVNAASSDVDGDGVQIYYAHHVWVDHCDIYDAPDGNLDIVHASSWVTVSWTRFHYTANAPAPNHRFSNLIGHTDGNAEDEGRLRVSFHHCHWADGVIERMPRVRYGQVHLWNNLLSAQGNNYAVGAGFEAQLNLDSNVFDGVNDPHVFYDAEPSAQIAAHGNLYLGASAAGRKDSGQGASFVPPYPHVVDLVADVDAKVRSGAGPR